MPARLLLLTAVRVAVCLAGMGLPALSGAAKPLAEAAVSLSKTMAKGMIVTAEGSNGEVKYSVAGSGVPGGTAPERVIFEIGSITKVFTALLLAQAVTEGRVTLDTTLSDRDPLGV